VEITSIVGRRIPVAAAASRQATIAERAKAAVVILAVTLGASPGVGAHGSHGGGSQSGAGTAGALPPAGIYTIDPPHTFVYFSAQHLVVGRVRGRFDQATGTITVAGTAAESRLDVSIDASSLSTQNSMRDKDLRGPDFFDAANFPTIKYQGRGIRRAGDGWVVEGSLTLRGTTKPVPLSFTFKGTAPAQPGKPARIAFHATAAVKRADFGMTRELLDEIGAVSPSPDVWIEIDAEVLAAPPSGSPSPRR
jgi:polyisoprenoid-binding protein YceI